MARQIQSEIDKLTASITKLQEKVKTLQSELSSGQWGAQQLKEFQAVLDKTVSTLSAKTAKRATLMDNRDTKELTSLNKAIDTIRRNLDQFNREKARVGQTLGGRMSDDYKEIEKAIIKAERALSSFEARRSKRFDPVTGYRLTDQQIKDKQKPVDLGQSPFNDKQKFSPADVERRLNQAILGFPLTNAEVEAKVGQARETARKILEESRKTNVAVKAAATGGAANQPGPNQRPLAGLDLGAQYNQAIGRKSGGADNVVNQAEERAKAAQKLAESNKRYEEAIEQAKKLNLKLSDLRKIEDRGGGIQALTFSKFEGGKQTNFKTYVNEYGKATAGLSSQFRSFGSDIVRDIGQFTKWSIAVAAVYTPLQKLGELMQIMVENESRLADATIAANIPFEKSGEIFDAVAEAAQQSGESITGVIDAYAQAFRAAGRYTDETVKSQKATALLNDSLILSKLSSLDQAGAIDTLTAALLQSDMELDQGQALLNKWVRVSQVANVDIATLATGVAVLGDSAETAGLSVDHLNGLVAVLAEQSISGSKEAANTAKALIGAYQSDTAEATLAKYGIALRRANGEARDFLDVYQQLASLKDAGVLSEPNIGEISTALGGGGSRRAKDVAALINSQDRLNNLAKESSLVTGESDLANDSLAKKLETVQTATTKASNAFQSLAQTLGDEGGLLDVLKLFLNITTGITGAVDDLFTVMGRSGPILATVAASLLAITKIPQTRRDLFVAGLFGGPGAQKQPFGASPGLDLALGRQFGAKGFGQGVIGDVLSLNRRGAGILGGGAIAAAGITNLTQGRNEQAIGNVIGGVIGAAIGSTLGGPVGLAAGAAIGSSVGDSFVSALLTHSQDLEDYFAGLIPEPGAGKAPGEALAPTEKTLEELLKEAYKEVGGGNELVGSLNSIEALINSRIQATIASGGANASGGFATSEAALLDILKRQNPELYGQIEQKYTVQQAQNNIARPGSTDAEFQKNQQLIQELQALADEERQKQLGLLSQGKIRPTEYNNISQALSGFPAAAFQDVQAFGDAFNKISTDIKSTEDAYKALVEFTVYGTEEQSAKLAEYVLDIQKLQAAWDSWIPGQKPLVLDLTSGSRTFASRDELAAATAQAQGTAAQYTQSSILESRLQRLNLPNVVGSYTDPTSAEDQNEILAEGAKIQEQFFKDMGLSADEIAHLVSNIEAFAVYTEDAGRTFYDTVEGLNQWAYDAARKSLEELGKIGEGEKGIGFQKFDIPIAQLEQLAAQSLSIGQNWQERFNYDFKPEDQIAIDNQGIVQPLHADFKILALLLEKIVDQNQKQLDGQYNIPEGATFWVPLTAAYYRNQGGGGAGDLMQGLDLTENTSATDQNTAALQAMNATFGNVQARWPEYFASEKTSTPIEEEVQRRTGHGPQYTAKGAEFIQDRALDAYHNSERDRGDSQTVQQNNTQSLVEAIKQGLMTFIQTGPFKDLAPGARGAMYGEGTAAGRSGSRDTAVNTAPVSRLDLKLQANTTLNIDGRVIATALQNYLASDLLRTDNSQGTITKRYVI